MKKFIPPPASEFSKPKQLFSNECLALEALRFMVSYHMGSGNFCFSQLDVSSRDLPPDRQLRPVPWKIVKIEGAFVQVGARQPLNVRFVAHVHIVKESSRNTAQQVHMVALSTTGLGERDAHNMWFLKEKDVAGNFTNQLIVAMRRPLPKQKS